MDHKSKPEIVDDVRFLAETFPFGGRYLEVKTTQRHAQAYYDFQAWFLGRCVGLGFIFDEDTKPEPYLHWPIPAPVLNRLFKSGKGYDTMLVLQLKGESEVKCRYIMLDALLKLRDNLEREDGMVLLPHSCTLELPRVTP